MPIETRRIDFSDVELRNALSLYQEKTVGGKAVSHIRAMGNGDDFSIVAKVSSTDGQTIQKVFDIPTSLAVLVLYAKQASIPLPKAANKSLSATEFGGISLSVRYLHKVI
ncbi:hypothetical protein RYZ26_07810 [Terasakiella sp. A23]|uniref:hypothetical protein n=1 Tax=Terasakiella sp. FCG-A23 TaxID=3080561 RepID=UPI0029537C33|nr:hypothetical protein [Terasakiella sp. A23]MDV7339492.1 hypothetical protein [Terasakiella sp. A23]